jgi:hypothetical protein
MSTSDLKRTTYRLYYGARIDRRKAKRVERILASNLLKFGNPWGEPKTKQQGN